MFNEKDKININGKQLELSEALGGDVASSLSIIDGEFVNKNVKIALLDAILCHLLKNSGKEKIIIKKSDIFDTKNLNLNIDQVKDEIHVYFCEEDFKEKMN